MLRYERCLNIFLVTLGYPLRQKVQKMLTTVKQMETSITTNFSRTSKIWTSLYAGFSNGGGGGKVAVISLETNSFYGRQKYRPPPQLCIVWTLKCATTIALIQ